MKSILTIISKQLQDIEITVDKIMHPSNVHIIPKDLFVEHVIATNDIFIDDLNTEQFNHQTASQLINGIIDINNGFVTDRLLHFKQLKIENSISPSFINGHPIHLLLKKYETRHLRKLTVEGSIIFEKDVNVGGLINNMKIDVNNVLLTEGDQLITGGLIAPKIKTKHMFTPIINKADLRTINTQGLKPLVLRNIENLSVNKLYVNGLLNEVDIPTIDKLALRKFGDQEITARYTFKSISMQSLHVDGLLSGKKVPEKMIRIDGDNFTIQNDVLFLNDLIVNDLQVLHSLNEIVVNEDGALDILLRNSNKTQYITGHKTLNNVLLLNPFQLRGKIPGKALDKINPFVSIEEEIHVEGDYVIFGNVTVDQFLQAKDLTDTSGRYSVTRLHEKGITLKDKEIPYHVDFKQPLSVSLEYFVIRVNFNQKVVTILN